MKKTLLFYAVVPALLIGLMILTYFGTHAQKDLGLVGAQREYFESLFCRLDLGLIGLDGWGMRFPGAFLLLILLAVVGSLGEVDRVLRPEPGVGFSPLRARGGILLAGDGDESALADDQRELSARWRGLLMVRF